MNNNDEVLVFNDVTPTGRRKLFVKRAGSAVDVSRYLALVPEVSRSEMLFDEFEIPAGNRLSWYCLTLEWATREVIGFSPSHPIMKFDGFKKYYIQDERLSGGELIPAVAWTVSRDERLSGALLTAAELFWATFGIYPRWGLIRAKSSPSPTIPFPLGDGSNFIKIVPMESMWRGMVVVL